MAMVHCCSLPFVSLHSADSVMAAQQKQQHMEKIYETGSCRQTHGLMDDSDGKKREGMVDAIKVDTRSCLQLCRAAGHGVLVDNCSATCIAIWDRSLAGSRNVGSGAFYLCTS